jgi:hypothetical protein
MFESLLCDKHLSDKRHAKLSISKIFPLVARIECVQQGRKGLNAEPSAGGVADIAELACNSFRA